MRVGHRHVEIATMEPKPVHFGEESDEEEQNPGAFMWIEGDSLAPPCQSDRDVVSKIVEIARVTPDDVRPVNCRVKRTRNVWRSLILLLACLLSSL